MLCMSSLTLRIPHVCNKPLQDFCVQQKRPVSDVVRESLRRYLAVERFQALRRKTLPFAEAQGILTDEDVSRIVS